MNGAEEGRVLLSTHHLERAGALREAFQVAGYEVELVTPDEDVSGGPPIELLVVTGSAASATARGLVARAHAEDMARHGYLSHTNPKGQDALARVQAARVEGFRLLAENIGASSVSGDRIASIVEEWLRSPTHRENLLNPAFNTTGVAVVKTDDGRTLSV